MRDRVKAVIFSLFIIALIVAYIAWGHLLSFETIKGHRAGIKLYTEQHYTLSVVLYISILMSTAFFVPGALVMSMLGGFLFGTVLAIIYIDAGMTAGAVLAFLTARYVLGNRLQEKFAPQLKVFNEEIKAHGSKYLAVLRILPVMPFFAVNYLAAMTKISLLRFSVSTLLGILPGAFTYAYAGEQLSSIESLKGLVTPRMILAIVAMAALTLIPVFFSHSRRWMKRNKAA